MKNYKDFIRWGQEVGKEVAKQLALASGISLAQIELWEFQTWKEQQKGTKNEH